VPGCLLHDRSERTSSTPQLYQLLAKGTTMSDQNTGFMADLDQWSEREVILPLADAYTHGPEQVINSAKEMARKAIRAKVLESYRNGQAAGPRTPMQRRSYAKR
jgi:hypothetical protein